MIRACIFDIGNVLCFFSHEKMFQQMAEVCGVTEELMREQILGSGLGVNYEKGDRLTSLPAPLRPHLPFVPQPFSCPSPFRAPALFVPVCVPVPVPE